MSWIRGAIAAALLSTVMAGGVAAEESMRILTYPLGLVLDELEVEAELGAGVENADLFLDGEKVCSLTADAASCTVDLGPDPHVHLLELVGQDGGRAERWLNRPGEEAELDLALTPAAGERCGARLDWAHPERLDPVGLDVTLDGERLELAPDGRSVGFTCPPASDAAHALIASAAFADGRRVEAVVLVGGFGGRDEVVLTALPLVSDREPAPACEPGAAGWPVTADRIEPGGFQLVFVLDPKARIGGSFSAGGSPGNRIKAPGTLVAADHLWYVVPDEELHRINGLALEGWRGGHRWLDLMFKLGNAAVPRPHRIADAVAASGLVAGAGAYRRAVVLVLGKNAAERDDSLLTPDQAREYLAEVGVPLIVLRTGKRSDDGWPAGPLSNNMDRMTDSLRQVRQALERQCIAWFGAELSPSRLSEVLPKGVRLAGRGGEAPRSPESKWARADLEATAATTGTTAGAVAGERIDVTAITILVSAVDPKGHPIRDLRVGDLDLREDGVVMEVRALEPVVSRTWIEGGTDQSEAAPGQDEAPDPEALPVTIYIDRTLAGNAVLRRAVGNVAAQLDRLATLGPVEVVVGEDRVKTVVGPTREVPLLAAALEVAVEDLSPRHTVEKIRKNFGRDLQGIGPTAPLARWAILQAARQEYGVVSRSLDRLGDWSDRQPAHRAGLLVLVGAGFDEDPARFYVPIGTGPPDIAAILREELRKWRQEDTVDALGRRLAASGWRVLSVAGGGASSGWTLSAEHGGQAKVRMFNTAGSYGSSVPEFLMLAPLDPLRHLALPSGGDLVVSKAKLRSALDGIAGWYQLTYEVSRAPDDVVRDLRIESRRPGISLTSSQTVVSVTLEGCTGALVLNLLETRSEPDLGELPVALMVGTPRAEKGDRRTARIDATVDLTAVGDVLGGAGTRLRISIAVAPEKEEPTVIDRQEELSALPASGEWVYTFPVQWPKGETRIAVIVEDLATGLWGGAVTDLPATLGDR